MVELNLVALDEKVRTHWKKQGIEKKALEFRKGKESFYFLDGPPYASGAIHVGTALNKIMKDYYVRYYRARGYDVWAQPGYYTHTLPL